MKKETEVIHNDTKKTNSAAENIDSTYSVSAPEFQPTVGGSNLQLKENPLQMSEMEEEEIQMKKAPFQLKGEEEEKSMQMKKDNPANTSPERDSSTQTKLPEAVQAKMESSFGADFSNVSILKNSSKAENLGAQAYAQGSEIHFAPSKYDPNSQSGQELIGHELTHVVQQRQGRVQPTTQRKGTNVNDSSSLEQEADNMGKKAAKGLATENNKPAKGNNDTNQVSQLQPEAGSIIKDLVGYAGKAQQIHEAVAGLGTDEDTIFKILLPLSKNGVKALQRTYKLMYGVELVADLRSDLTNDEFRRALIYIFCWPTENEIIGSFQAERAQEMLLQFSASKVAIICDLILMLNRKQASYFYKALASGNSTAALIIFAYIIKGKSDDWLQNNLSLTGHTDGSGIKQQYSHSCNATAVQAFRGEMDPIYAYRMILTNTDVTAANNNNATAINPSMAADQKSMLESGYSGSLGNMAGGRAVNRSAPNGVGRWADDLLNSNSDDTGVSYSTLRRGDGHSLNKLILSIKKGAKRGIPVPIVIGGTPTSYTHYVVVTSIDTSVTPNSFTVHDVGSGSQYIVTEDDFRNSTIGIPRLNTLSAVEDVTEE